MHFRFFNFQFVLLVSLQLLSCATREPTDFGTLVKKPAPKKPAPSRPLPTPGSDNADWVRLTSGEWLRGELLYLRREKLMFDSDKLDDLEIDWEDVAEFHSTRSHSCQFEDRTTATGPILIREGVVTVGGEEGRCVDRDQLVSLVPGDGTEASFWSGKASANVSIRSGNTDQTDFTARATINRRTPLSRLTLEYLGNFSVLNDEETTNNQKATGLYGLFLTRRFFVIPGFLEYYRDRFANIDYRITPGAGAGYEIVDNASVELDVFSLGGARFTRFDEVSDGEPRTDETGVVVSGVILEVDFTSDIEFTAQYRIDVGLDDVKDTNHQADATLSVDLTKIFDLDVSIFWTHIGNPGRDSAGDTIERNDTRLMAGIGVDF